MSVGQVGALIAAFCLFSQALAANFTWSASVTSIVPARTYPACAWDMHSAVNIPAMWYLNGETGTTTTALNSDGYVSYDGFTTSSVYLSMPISGANATILRRAGSAAYLANGNLLVFGGKTTGSVVLQSVIVSNNSGVSWYPAATTAAMWPARSDMASCVMPYTNTVVVMGGLLASGSSTNDVWISSDGQGAVWTQQPTTLTTTWASSPCVGLYPMSVGANSSLILTTNVATIYTSHNLGYSFSAVITAPWTTRNYITLVTDRDNIVYATGGQGIQDANVYVSFDVGNTWSTTSSTYNFANGLLNQQYFEASTSCSAIQIVTLNGIWYKQLTVYGGTILLNTSLTATTPVEAIHATSTSSYHPLLIPIGTWSASESLIVPQRTYPACAWDMHSAVNVPTMWYLTGESGTTSTALVSDGYVSYDGFYSSSVHLNLSGTYGAAIPRRAGSAAYLANNNLILYGGKTTGGTYLQTVLVSPDGGVSFYAAATTSSMWSARSDMTTCVIPNTNIIFLMAGQTAVGSQSDVWISSDGQGAVWMQQPTPAFAGWASAPCAGLYAFSGIINQTVIALTNTGLYYITNNFGYSFSAAMTGPVGGTQLYHYCGRS